MSLSSTLEAVALKGTTDAIELRNGALWLGQQRVESLKYRFGRVNDEVSVNGTSFTVPSGKGAHLQRLILRWRLRPPAIVPGGACIDAMDETLAAWLATWLAHEDRDEELLLAALATSKEVSVESSMTDEQTRRAVFVLTDRRSALVAINPLGDVWVQALSAPIRVESERGRDRVTSGEHEWLTSRTNEKRFHEVAPWSAVEERTRLRLALDGALDAGELERAEYIAAKLQDARSRVALWLRAKLDTPDAFVWAQFSTDVGDSGVAWSTRWQLSQDAQTQLVSALRGHSAASPIAVALHETHVAAAGKQTLAESAATQIGWAEHLRAAGREEDAAKVLEDALASLADGDAMDLVPHGDVDEPNPQVRARVRILEAKRSLLTGPQNFDATLALARLEPLQLKRVADLIEVAPLPLADRASVVGSILSGGLDAPGLSAPDYDAPLADEELALLRHPIGRTDEFLGGLSTLVASIERPDHSALRAYCPRLRDETRRAVFQRAAKRLGVKADIYVSGGDDAVGCFGHEDDESMFVVLGGHHVDETKPRFLSPVELSFAFGSELAHLRFGHSRVTSSALWKGAFDLGVSGFDVLLSAVPLLGRYKIGDGISKLANAFKDGSAQKLGRRARKLLKFGKDDAETEDAEQIDDATDSNARADQLITAHRLMQLGADRAGLLVCGHPAPAIKAMLALDGGDALKVYRKDGLYAMATMRSTEGQLVYAELTLRICALLSFWLSEDYSTLAAET
ncbi:MAG: hypothetical protein AB8H86_25210 [Polyangiales bacterium]